MQPNAIPVMVALLRPGWEVRQKLGGAVVTQKDVKEGVPWKSSFISGNVHDDGYLFLLQQHSAQTGYFVRIRNVTKRTLKDKIKRRGKGDGGRG